MLEVSDRMDSIYGLAWGNASDIPINLKVGVEMKKTERV